MEHTDVDMGKIFSALPPMQELIHCYEYLWTRLPRQLHYDFSLALSVLSCKETTSREHSEDTNSNDDSGENSDFLHSLKSFFSSLPEDTLEASVDGNVDDCEGLINFNTTTSLSPSTLTYAFVAVTVIWLTFMYFVCFYLQFRKSVDDEDFKHATHSNISLNDAGDHLSQSSGASFTKESGDCTIEKSLKSPLLMKTEATSARGIKPASLNEKTENVFEFTVQRYLKGLDLTLGMCTVSSGAAASHLPASQSSMSSLTSPRLARKISPQTCKIVRSPSLIDRDPRYMDESYSKSWITFEMFKKRMCWQFPVTHLDNTNITQFSQNNKKLAMILQFLYQNCCISPHQWDIATSVVNYSLFMIENELKNMCKVSQDCLKVSRFEVSGSAADGTLIGSADRFDVLLVLDICSHSELMVLHNNFSDEIPPGCVVLGVKEQNSHKEGMEFSRKAYIDGLFGFYFQPQNVVDKVEALLEKAVLRLNREHKKKLDSLPFSFQVSQSKKLVLTIDARLLQSFGLGVDKINVRITPAIELSVPEYCLLPPLFAIPLIKNSASSPESQPLTGNGVMSRLFLAKGITDLHWLVHTESVHSAILVDFEKHFAFNNVRGHHKECLMILKAIFSSSHHKKLLNKGEVDSYVLKTVVSFLLQESSPSAWTLENLANRVSDAVHFIRSAYENAWLPELCVHNPHLLGKVPSLKVMSHVLHGRQRNLLALVTNTSSLKVLDYVTHRLNETRLVNSLNENFSPDMWEYEFFMFG
ncbi:hypothetical protein EGW08_011869 [Elysia chlorotica]|uniref:Uncharacterized protein n=1 Tax=Elysia chlorotica TaxID=188477 RepID=A0A433TFM6_ELYCH|nr:hypothetical protein EGW08_011869 [Elysia chlorotica]